MPQGRMRRVQEEQLGPQEELNNRQRPNIRINISSLFLFGCIMFCLYNGYNNYHESAKEQEKVKKQALECQDSLDRLDCYLKKEEDACKKLYECAELDDGMSKTDLIFETLTAVIDDSKSLVMPFLLVSLYYYLTRGR